MRQTAYSRTSIVYAQRYVARAKPRSELAHSFPAPQIPYISAEARRAY